MDFRETKKLADEARETALRLCSAGKITREEEAQMVTCAQACVFLWSKAGTNLQVARSHWLVSRVFVRLGESRLAQLHAQLCDINTKKAADRKDFDDAYAVEALARVAALKNDVIQARKLKDEAIEAAKSIRDLQEREIFLSHLASGPWGVLEGSS